MDVSLLEKKKEEKRGGRGERENKINNLKKKTLLVLSLYTERAFILLKQP